MKQEIEAYLKRLEEQFNYTEEQLEAVKEFRESAEHVPWEQYRFLLEQRLLNRSRKLKKIRNLYYKEEDEKIYYLNHYYKRYEWIATFHSDEFLAERNLKEQQERELIERIRTDKKVLKAEANKPKEIVVKPKRKRINA